MGLCCSFRLIPVDPITSFWQLELQRHDDEKLIHRNTVLIEASRAGDISVVKDAIRAGADVNCCLVCGLSLLSSGSFSC